jgi:hypothetical protein
MVSNISGLTGISHSHIPRCRVSVSIIKYSIVFGSSISRVEKVNKGRVYGPTFSKRILNPEAFYGGNVPSHKRSRSEAKPTLGRHPARPSTLTPLCWSGYSPSGCGFSLKRKEGARWHGSHV